MVYVLRAGRGSDGKQGKLKRRWSLCRSTHHENEPVVRCLPPILVGSDGTNPVGSDLVAGMISQQNRGNEAAGELSPGTLHRPTRRDVLPQNTRGLNVK